MFRDFAFETRKSGDILRSTQVCRADCWPGNRGGEPATVIEQKARFFRLKLPVGKSCEMKNAPKAVCSIGEVESGRGRPHSGIDADEEDIQGRCDDVGQANRFCSQAGRHIFRTP